MGGDSFLEARRRLLAADTREAIVEETVGFVRSRLRYAAMFVVGDDHFVGIDAWGASREADRGRIRGVRVSRSLHSFLALAVAGRAPRLGPSPRWAVNRLILDDMGRDGRAGMLVVPIFMRGRPVLMLYADNGPEPVPSEVSAQVIAFTASIPVAADRLLTRRRAGPQAALRAAALSGGAPVRPGTRAPAPATGGQTPRPVQPTAASAPPRPVAAPRTPQPVQRTAATASSRPAPPEAPRPDSSGADAAKALVRARVLAAARAAKMAAKAPAARAPAQRVPERPASPAVVRGTLITS